MKRPLREPVRDAPGPKLKNYITPAGLLRLKDEYRFLMYRERPAVTPVVAWAAGNGDRSENAGYLYGKRRLRQIVIQSDPHVRLIGGTVLNTVRDLPACRLARRCADPEYGL